MGDGYRSSQELFWSGEFGNSYIERNNYSADVMASNLNLFSKILDRTVNIGSIIEFGSNIGLNLKALNLLLPRVADISAIEINSEAVKALKADGMLKHIYEGSILDFKVDYQRDFVLIKGVLIHINPNMLDLAYERLYETSRKYICVAEYYNPTPVAVSYQGHEDRLFKRDFVGEILDKYENLELVDYGFAWTRDNNFKKNDDINWFLLEKRRGV